MSIINDLRGYKNVITEMDMSVIEEQWNKLQQISLVLQEFDVIASTIMNVLSKGEYEL